MLTRKQPLSIIFATFIFLFVIFIAPVSPHSTSIDNPPNAKPEIWLGYNRQNIENWNGIGAARAESCGFSTDYTVDENSKISLIPCMTFIEPRSDSITKINSLETSISPSTYLRYTWANTILGENIGYFLRAGLGAAYEELSVSNGLDRFWTGQLQSGVGLFLNLEIRSFKLKGFGSGYFTQVSSVFPRTSEQSPLFSLRDAQFSTEVGLEIRYDLDRGVFGTWKRSFRDSANTFYFGVVAYQGKNNE